MNSQVVQAWAPIISNAVFLAVLMWFIGNQINSVNKRIDDLREHVDKRIDDMNRRIDDLNTRIDDLKDWVRSELNPARVK